MMTTENTNFTGHLLIAMPSMNDPFFAKTVTLICTHNQEGAMGIMINRPTDMTVGMLFEKINLPLQDSSIAKQAVLYGGPVQPERGFVIHDNLADWDNSTVLYENIVLTSSKDILVAVAEGRGPKHMLLSLGYAGWTAGQLEQEMTNNAWLSVQPKSPEILTKLLFDTPHSDRLNTAIGLLGFDPSKLSDIAGHA